MVAIMAEMLRLPKRKIARDDSLMTVFRLRKCSIPIAPIIVPPSDVISGDMPSAAPVVALARAIWANVSVKRDRRRITKNCPINGLMSAMLRPAIRPRIMKSY